MARLQKSTDSSSLAEVVDRILDKGIVVDAWMKELPEGQDMLITGISRSGDISPHLGGGQVNRIYKRIAKAAGLDESVIKWISGHSMRVGAAQDLLSSGASMPIMMQRGRGSKSDTVMRYVEHI